MVGLEALKNARGTVGAPRFLQQFGTGNAVNFEKIAVASQSLHCPSPSEKPLHRKLCGNERNGFQHLARDVGIRPLPL